MDQDATLFGTKEGLDPDDVVLDGDPAPLPQKGHSNPSSFRPMTIVTMVAHLSYTSSLVVSCNWMSAASVAVVVTFW